MHKFVVCLCTIFSLEVFLISGLPYPYDLNGYRLRRSPQRAVMVSGYYGRPFRGVDYEPEGAMTAFVTGETVATNSYLGGTQFNPLQQESEELEIPIEENGKKSVQQVLPEKPLIPLTTTEGAIEESNQDEIAEAATTKPKRVPKRKQVKPQEDEEEDSEGGWPFNLGGRKGTSYNAFFPVMLGGYQTRGREGESGYPGSATAIANSFSTGRGGVASSHATAYGDPYVSTLLRNNGYNFKKKPSSQKEEY